MFDDFRRWLIIFCVLVVLPGGCRGAVGVRLPDETAPRLNPPVARPPLLADWPDLGASPLPGYEVVGQSDALRLYFDRETSAIAVEERRSGRIWRSSPADLDENAALNKVWRRRIASPILVSYVGPERRQVKVVDSLKAGVERTAVPVAGGVQVGYRFPREGFALSVIYTVVDDALHVLIPDEDVRKEGENGLVSVQVLAFLGAAHDGEAGYLFFPDGSGALVRYTTPHPPEVQEISRVLYGPDALSDEAETTFRQPVALPVFGAVVDEGAFLGVITQGDFDAKISVARSGKRVNYNHVGVEFLYRRQGLFSLSGGRPVQVYEPERIGGDRQVRYYFLSGEAANYVGMAARYREFLLRERGAQRVTAAPLLHLELFMGVERKTWFFRDLIAMTSLGEAQAILADLAEAGVTRLDVTLRGWNRGGDMARYPRRLPVEARLGGVRALRALVEEAQGRGARVLLFDDYERILPTGRGALPQIDAVRATSGLPVSGPSGGYVLNAQVALRKFAARDVPRMAAWGVGGLDLNDWAALAIPDSNTRYPLSREGFAATWMQIAALVREQMGAVAMRGGNGYAVLYADLLSGVPLDSTHYDLVDETVPFYQIVTHGLAAYCGPAHNLLGDGQRMFLRQIEYGAVPYFILTRANSALLYRTPANWLSSSEYAFWRDEVIRQYRAMTRLAHVSDQFIVGHARLAEGVYRTTFEDGTQVVVNYGPAEQTVDGVTVSGRDFVVLGP